MTTRKTPWKAPAPDASSVAAVRKIRVCIFCKNLGSDLLVLSWKARGKKMVPVSHAHAYCLVKKRGEKALAALPASEISKVTVNDLLGLGWRYQRVANMVDVARRTARNK